MVKVRIIGGGGFGKEVRSLLSQCNRGFAGFIDDKLDENIKSFKGRNNELYFIALGDSNLRSYVHSTLPKGLKYDILIHPTVILQERNSVSIGKGSILCARTIVTCDVIIANHVLINLNCTIGHDCRLDSFVSLMPSVNLGGNVHLKEGVYVGTNATILPGVTVGEWSIIGAGSVVTKDIPPHSTVKGIPAK